MRSTRTTCLIACVVLLVTAPASATGEPANAAQGHRTRRANPYSRLFQTPGIKTTSQREPPTSSPGATAPKVVCGMTVIPADPSIDPKIFIGPRSRDTRYTMRIIPPPVCK